MSGLHPNFAQLLQQGIEMMRLAAGDIDVASGKRAGDDKRARLDAVGNDAMARAA